MSLPSVVKTWQYDINNSFSSTTIVLMNSLLLFNVKESLIGFGTNPWTVEYSCDSVTAGAAGDGVDRWATSANVVRGNAGSAHSWTVLLQAGISSNFQILISASAEGTVISAGNYCISVYASPSAGFTGGTTTARPTATDEIELCRTNSWGGTSPSATATNILQSMQATDGSCTRITFCCANVSWSQWVLDKTANTVTGWTIPFFALCSNPTSGSFPSAASTVTAFQSAISTAQGKIYATGTSVATIGVGILTSEGNSTGVNSSDTTYGNATNEIDSSWAIYPIGVSCSTATIRGRHGSIIDMWFGSTGVATGDTYDATSKTFAQFGGFVMPWDGTSTPVVS